MDKKVLVGLPGPWATDYSEPADRFTSKIGGLPDFPFPVDAIRPELLQCDVCNCRLVLVCQVYAPVNEMGVCIEDRTLYIFGCVTPKCGVMPLSWRAIRLQKAISSQDASVGTMYSEKDVSGPAINFLEDEDDDDYSKLSLEELSKSFIGLTTAGSESSDRNLQEKKKKIKLKDYPKRVLSHVPLSSPTVLPCFYLYTQEESSAGRWLLPLDERKYNLPDHDTEKWNKEDYIYDEAFSADRTYLKYKKVVDQCPEQCFRYKYGGKQLLATKSLYRPSRCQQCGAPRHYEMQLMPPLVYFLHEGTTEKHPLYSLDYWNWMTLIIYTCQRNCSSISHEDSSVSESWTVAVEEIEMQLEEEKGVTASLLAQDYQASGKPRSESK